MGISVSITGIEGINKALFNYDKILTKDLSDEINASALKIQLEAKKKAPINMGNLRRSIELKKETNLTYYVAAKASYAPYIEFGTGGKVSVPLGYESYAIQFKGSKSGTYYDFLMAIVEWIKRKGITAGVYNIKTRRRVGNKSQKFDEDVKMAERIAYSILKKGISPQPFLIPSFEEEIPKLFKRLNEMLNVKS